MEGKSGLGEEKEGGGGGELAWCKEVRSEHDRPSQRVIYQVMVYEGETVHGQAGILGKLKAVAQMNSTFGRVIYEVDHIDAQALGTVGAAPNPNPYLLHVGPGAPDPHSSGLSLLRIPCHWSTWSSQAVLNSHRLRTVPLQDGSAVVHVMGRMVVSGMSHLGEGASTFSEVFSLGLSQSGSYPYYIANQMFRLLK